MEAKLLVTGDIHIGRRSSGAPSESSIKLPPAKNIWFSIVNYAIENKFDFLILTGDIIDRENRYYEAVGPLTKGLLDLASKNIKIVMTSGNHDFDVLKEIIKDNKFENIYLLGSEGGWEYRTIETGSKKSLFFAGWSFHNESEKEDPLLSLKNGDQLKKEYKIAESTPLVGIIHGDIYNKKSIYAPLDKNIMLSSNFDAWLMGHIHKADIINKSFPLILYPGSPQALDAGETGTHGAYSVTITNNLCNYKMVPLSPVRYEKMEVDISNTTGREEFRNKVTEEIYNSVEELYNTNNGATEHLNHIVFDLLLKGEHSDIENVENWCEKFLADDTSFTAPYKRGNSDNFAENVIVRKIKNEASQKIPNIEKLAEQKSVVGIAAKALIDLEKGVENSIVEKIKKNWYAKYDEMIRRNKVYAYLNKDKDNEERERLAKEYILKELKKTLSHFYKQKQ
ncbi:DNA repair exonuclease [Marinilabiliaceae bacterium ANBcel2]|nr:DNA repair exonuclease [Marinilabiliaceae bacterium ANBcel2]